MALTFYTDSGMIRGKMLRTADQLSTSFERLSSGLRINKASDDPAGLALAANLNAEATVYTQAVRNLNDGISAMSVADVATQELDNILGRLSELATQASNGTYTTSQRMSLDAEAQALREEYNRIVSVTSFNDQKLLDGTMSSLTLQAGSGANGAIRTAIAANLDRQAGTGSFGAAVSFVSAATGSGDMRLGDFNHDGLTDAITTGTDPGNQLHLFLGNGDGTFRSYTSFALTGSSTFMEQGDVNGDGYLDAVTSIDGSGVVDVLLGNGNGSFNAKTSYTTEANPSEIRLSDLDGDSDLDMMVKSSGVVNVLLSNGDGSFKARTTYAGVNGAGLTVADMNGDGITDLITPGAGVTSLRVHIGNGDGSFRAGSGYAQSGGSNQAAARDLNNDGFIDVVSGNRDVGGFDVFLGRGDGTLSAAVSFGTANANHIKLGDVNDDGNLDLVTAVVGSPGASVYLGNGDGSFGAGTVYGGVEGGVYFAELNGDEVLDIVGGSATGTSFSVLLGNTTTKYSMAQLNLRTRDNALAALSTIEMAKNRLISERGAIGAFESRIEVARNHVELLAMNFREAESRIRDVDIAQETANMVWLQVLQQAQAAVLAQANSTPQRLLSLLA